MILHLDDPAAEPAGERPPLPPSPPCRRRSDAEAIAAARAAIHRAGLSAANKPVELGDTAATDRAEALDRYGRNVRTHTLPDPVRWKSHWIGAYHFDGRHPPRHGAL